MHRYVSVIAGALIMAGGGVFAFPVAVRSNVDAVILVVGLLVFSMGLIMTSYFVAQIAILHDRDWQALKKSPEFVRILESVKDKK